MSLEGWLLVTTIVLLVASMVVGVLILVELRRLKAIQNEPIAVVVDDSVVEEPQGPLFAFIANPSKPSVANLKAPLLARCDAEGFPEPLWIETTVDDPGTGQAREAVAAGADVVVALGGDGTVRAVATALTESHTPMGIIPVGTGNLLARNLDIPVSSLDAAFEILTAGVDRKIDVGWLQVTSPDSSERDRLKKIAQASRSQGRRERAELKLKSGEANPASSEKHLFLVISGVGFDAAMIADADSNLKAKLGWMAYFVSGIRHLHSARLNTRITLDGKIFTTRLRSLMVGNCGKLPGGITLIPDAVIDDGIHDIAAVDTRGGIAGWVQLFGEVMLQGVGVQTKQPLKVGRIDHTQAREVTVAVEGGAAVQVDGDIVGRGKVVKTWVDARALTVRVPLPKLDSR